MILESHRVRMLIVTRVIFMQTRYRRCESTRADVGPNEMCAQNVGTNTFLFVLIWPAAFRLVSSTFIGYYVLAAGRGVKRKN